jgi:alpha-tubulin suppressor-like RCC1 family protein
MQAPALWIWGQGAAGSLGDNSTIRRSSPVQTVSGGTNWRSVSTGEHHTIAIKTDGTLWSWGCNNDPGFSGGKLGNNSTINQSSPVQTVSGGTNWKSVSAGGGTSAAIKTDGTLWVWGGFSSLAFGERSSPVQTFSGGTNWRSIGVKTGNNPAFVAIKTDGTLWTWAQGFCGWLGCNGTAYQSSPVQTVSGGTNWRSVSAGYNSITAVKKDGTLWLWGGGAYGKLGDNSTTAKSSPVQTVSGGTNWRSPGSSSRYASAAIKTDGTLWLWGDGRGGGLGNNTTNVYSSPVQTISGGTNWRSVSLASAVGVAIKTDGTLWVWGCGADGRLGTNSQTSRSSPVQTVSDGNNWRSAEIGSSASNARTVAIRDEGEY